jgi:hypothetical protein
MTDENAGITDETAEAQTPPATGTPPAQDEITTLRSRNSGLDAKVTELSKAQKAAEQRAAEAAQKLADYEAGKVGADEALRAQIAAKDTELAQVRREAALARISSKYPETFGVLGDVAASLTDDQLAASEARMTGSGGETSTPPTLGANPGRGQSGRPKALDDMSAAEVSAYMRSLNPSVMLARND